MQKNEILLVLTGGTICSVEDKTTNKRNSNADFAKRMITEIFSKGQSDYAGFVTFDEYIPIDVLSENMTLEKLNVLVSFLKEKLGSKMYKGIVILHGTDTPAFTSSLLSLILCGIGIPVFIVSSHLPLWEDETNGNDNFRMAIELIMNGVEPNVYFIYKNTDGTSLLHYGARLKQCESYSQDFYSDGAIKIDEHRPAQKGLRFETDGMLINKMDTLTSSVLKISPYVGLDYSRFTLDGIKAVVHETFHSQTACAQIATADEKYTNFSVLSLLDRCNESGIPFFLFPCSEQSYKYGSTKLLLDKGALPVYGMTSEMMYIKTLVGVSLKLQKNELHSFLKKSINREFIARF